MSLRGLGEFLRGIPVTEWIGVARNTLRQLSLSLSFLFVAFLLIYLYPSGFSPEQRFTFIKGIGLLVLIVFAAVTILTALPGSLLYAPYERALERGRGYGSKERPQRRAVVLDKPKEAEPGLESPASPPELPAGGGR